MKRFFLLFLSIIMLVAPTASAYADCITYSLDELGMHKADSEDVVRVEMSGEKSNE